MHPVCWFVVLGLVAAGCSDQTAGSGPPPPSTLAPELNLPSAPDTPTGPVDPTVTQALGRAAASVHGQAFDAASLPVVGASRDARLAWDIADLLRFIQYGPDQAALVSTFTELTGASPNIVDGSAWRAATDQLIAWDLPAAPGYRDRKAALFIPLERGWKPFFTDADADIDWRLISWGGVLIDDRPAGSTAPCERGCIPALDDPALTPAAEGDWYADDRVVFGVTVGDEAVAFPRNIMEVHEMVNITIGGRRLGIPYCTLCGSAQAYFTDSVPQGIQTPVLRTSGLLSRSNKVMYDLATASVFDTFTGRAVSGPLQDAGITLEQTTVVATTWAQWRAAHPRTRIVARDGGVGASYPDDPLGGRDDDGPIFPIGPVDPRLPVQANVVGVVAPDGTPVAFPVDQARLTLDGGQDVTLAGVQIRLDGGGLRAQTPAGEELPAHQAFWFAWSQFHPTTVVWTPRADPATPDR